MIALRKLYKNKLVGHFLVYFGSGGISKAIPFLVLLLITNYLTIEEFGLISNFYVLVQLFSALIGIKLLVSFQADYYRHDVVGKRKLAINILYVQGAIAVLILCLSYVSRTAIESYLKIEFQWVVAAVLLSMSLNIFDLRSNILRLEEKPKIFAGFQITSALLNAILTVVFVVVLKLGWEGRIYGALLAGAVMLILSLKFLFAEKWFSEPYSKSIAKEQLLRGIPLLPQAITPFLRKGVDKIVLTGSSGLASNGIFSFAMNFGAIVSMFTDSLFSVITPNLYKHLAGLDINDDKQKEKVVLKTYFGFILLMLILVVCYFCFYGVIVILFDERYHQAVAFIPFILIEALLQSMSRYFSSFIIFTKRTAVFGSMIFSIGMVHTALSIFLIPIYGIKGALVALIGTEAIKFFLTFYLANKYYPMNWLSVPFSFVKRLTVLIPISIILSF